MKAFNWVASLVSWGFGVGGLSMWYVEATNLPMVSPVSAQSQLQSTSDLFLAVGAVGVILSVLFTIRAGLESRRDDERSQTRKPLLGSR